MLILDSLASIFCLGMLEKQTFKKSNDFYFYFFYFFICLLFYVVGEKPWLLANMILLLRRVLTQPKHHQLKSGLRGSMLLPI
jgi:hypothetical protein